MNITNIFYNRGLLYSALTPLQQYTVLTEILNAQI